MKLSQISDAAQMADDLDNDVKDLASLDEIKSITVSFGTQEFEFNEEEEDGGEEDAVRFHALRLMMKQMFEERIALWKSELAKLGVEVD